MLASVLLQRYWLFNNWCLIRSHGRNACYSLTLLVSQLKHTLQTRVKTVPFWKRNKHINKSHKWIMDVAEECVRLCVCVCVGVARTCTLTYVQLAITCTLMPLVFSVLVKPLISCNTTQRLNPLWAWMSAYFLTLLSVVTQQSGVMCLKLNITDGEKKALLFSRKLCKVWPVQLSPQSLWFWPINIRFHCCARTCDPGARSQFNTIRGRVEVQRIKHHLKFIWSYTSQFLIPAGRTLPSQMLLLHPA